MKKANITIDHATRTLTVTKAYNKKASVFGSPEYKELRQSINENPGYIIEIKTVEKKSYRGLSFSRMEEYIKTQPDSEKRLIEFEAVKKIAKAKGGLYPITKQWFFATYPDFKESSLSEEEINAGIAKVEAIDKAKEESQAKMELVKPAS